MQQQKMLSVKILRQRRFLLLLPVMVVPFLTFFLFSLGLVGSAKSKPPSKSTSGFNVNLPGALPSKDSNWNKLRFYEEADKDSARYRTLQKNDPNFISSGIPETSPTDTLLSGKGNANGFNSYYKPNQEGLQTGKDVNEEKVYRKLAQLNEELNKSKQSASIKEDDAGSNNSPVSAATSNADYINRLENMTQTMQGNQNAGDPEMQQISGMLEKILDIQHPERIKDKLKQQSEKHKEAVFPVTINDKKTAISLLQGKQRDSLIGLLPTQKRNSFYSLTDFSSSEVEPQNAITAIIPETQVLVSGATIKLILTNEVYINGILIPKDQFIYGTASMEGERLTINITTIRYRNNILPVALSVYDMDGMAGIYMPGTISRDVAKQSTDQAIQSIGLAGLDPSIGAQAASAGIQAIKSLTGKKARLVKVTVKAGYQVLLRDNNQMNE